MTRREIAYQLNLRHICNSWRRAKKSGSGIAWMDTTDLISRVMNHYKVGSDEYDDLATILEIGLTHEEAAFKEALQ